MKIFIVNISFAQQTEQPVTPTSQDYLKKSKTQTIFGVIVLSGGSIVLLRTALSSSVRSTANSFAGIFGAQPKKHSYAVPLLISAGSIIGGIALLSAASHNKRRAAAASAYLNLKMESFPALISSKVMTSSYPSISVTISF